MHAAFNLVAEEVAACGPLSFSRYMELALYHPESGFYANGGAGRRKDFITSPEVGTLFGTLVAAALDTWWKGLGRPDRFTFVDAGAGSGALARSVMRAKPECGAALHYIAVETSAPQRALHPPEVTSTAKMPKTIEAGVVLANELLDNLPFDIVQFDPGVGWREVRIDVAGSALREVLVDTNFDPGVDQLAERSLRMPVQHQAVKWLADTVASLKAGWIVVVDYVVSGYPVDPDRDWLRTYSDHTRDDLPLVAPGSKDITADIDVAALGVVRPIGIHRNQATWLRQHGIDDMVEEGKAYWSEHAAKPNLAAMAMRSRVNEAEALLDLDGLGAFSVLEWLITPS